MSIRITDKGKCCGCEACAQICSHNAIKMQEDAEGFRYPLINIENCVECGLCEKVCQYVIPPVKNTEEQRAFGGHISDEEILNDSTSGGAFTAIVNYWCDRNYVIFGAEARILSVFHSYITDKSQLGRFRKSKYSQSVIGTAYHDAKQFLLEGKKVLFSGTPCQIAGLKSYLGNKVYDNLLTVEVVCEGVPSPLLVRKLEESFLKKRASKIDVLDYRYKNNNKWDYQVMCIKYTNLSNNKKGIKKIDRWFNGFWSIWLNHLMSRPSCYSCLYTTKERIADITLGDLWGVHIYCPDLYNSNRGASLIITNTEKGAAVAEATLNDSFIGRELDFINALCYQGPMRKSISMNTEREAFMVDLKGSLDYDSILKKWAKPSNIKLLISKYIWGNNRQKVNWWRFKRFFKKLMI